MFFNSLVQGPEGTSNVDFIAYIARDAIDDVFSKAHIFRCLAVFHCAIVFSIYVACQSPSQCPRFMCYPNWKTGTFKFFQDLEVEYVTDEWDIKIEIFLLLLC